MVDPIAGLTKLVANSPALNKKSSPSDSTQPASSASSSVGDRVDLSANAALINIRAQAAQLKAELPGLIANSILQPASDSVNSQDPLSVLTNLFTDPVQTFLASPAAKNLAETQLQALRQDVAGLRDFIPQMQADSLLAPLADKSGSADSILGAMSSRLADLADLVLQKIQGV